jgi:hypothetical protein
MKMKKSEIRIIESFPKKRKKNSKKIFFFSKITKIFTTRKLLKMENKHSEHFCSA